jgi:putative sporulation protein YyaC
MNFTRLKEAYFPYRIEYTHPLAIEHFADSLYSALEMIPNAKDFVCVCIGTDRSTGDSLGPLVGTFLMHDLPPNTTVYGTLEEPVHALNLPATIQQIQYNHPHSTILAIDACLGQMRSVGSLQIGLGPLKPGAGVNKKLPEIGHIQITGIVNVSGFMEFMVLQNTRLNTVMKMAKIISASIIKAINKWETKHK